MKIDDPRHLSRHRPGHLSSIFLYSPPDYVYVGRLDESAQPEFIIEFFSKRLVRCKY